MKTLKDVYIKVTENNISELRQLLTFFSIESGDCLIFHSDDIATFDFVTDECIESQNKVSLSQLKKLIETMPTREEITRLKRQISAYKLNLGNYKHEIEMARNTVDQLHSDERILLEVISNVNKDNEQLNKMYDDLVLESGKKQNLLKNLYDDALKEIDIWKENDKNSLELMKEMNDDNLFLIKAYDKQKEENERLKNKKWYQIWKN